MIPFVNGFAEDWFRYMTSATFQATLLALFILGVLRLRRGWPPALRHAILMLALCKFLIPPMLSLPTGVFNHARPQSWFGSAPALRYVPQAVQSAIQPVRHSMPSAIPVRSASKGSVSPETIRTFTAPPVRKPTISAKGILLLLHLSGALLILGMAALQQLYLRRLAARARPAQHPGLAETYDALCRKMKPLRRPRLLVSEDNHAPVTFGAWKPVVVLPQAIVAALPQPEIRAILGHELAHHSRRDPWLAWLQVIISAVWWFNPVYWLLSRSIRSVREDCCDDMVVASGISSREGYCRTLLQAARVTCRNPMAGVALAYLSEAQPLRRRFKRIMTAQSFHIPKLARTGILAVFLLALLLLPGIKPRALAQNPVPAAQQPSWLMPAFQSSALPQTVVASQPQPASQGNLATSASQSSLSRYYRKWLDEDVIYIIAPEERNVFLALETDIERDSFIEQFWMRRGASFREEFYRRIAYANEHFASNAPGWKTDRGRIYIMYGKPDKLEAHPTGGAYNRPPNEGGGTTTTYPFEKWQYRHIDGVGDDIEIEFVDQSGSGEYKMAMSPDEKEALINVPNAGPTLAEEVSSSEKSESPGSFYYHVKMEPLGSIPLTALNPEMASTLIAKEGALAEYLLRYTPNHPDVLRLSREVQELREQAATASSDKALWRVTIKLNSKDLEFIKQQDRNLAIYRVYGKISTVAGHAMCEWEDMVPVEYPDQLLETGKTRESEYQKIVTLPPGDKFKVDIVVKDENAKKTGIMVWKPVGVFERVQQQ